MSSQKLSKTEKRKHRKKKNALGDITNAVSEDGIQDTKKFETPNFVKPRPRVRRSNVIREDTPARFPDDPLKSLLKYNGTPQATKINGNDPTQLWKCANVSTPSPLAAFSLACHTRPSPITPHNLNGSMSSVSSMDESPTTAYFQTLSRASKAAEKRFKMKESEIQKKRNENRLKSTSSASSSSGLGSKTVKFRNGGKEQPKKRPRSSSMCVPFKDPKIPKRSKSSRPARTKRASTRPKHAPNQSEDSSKLDQSVAELLTYTGKMQIPKLKRKAPKSSA
eukprot:501863_1